MIRSFFLRTIGLSIGVCLIGCAESESVHDRNCVQLDQKILEENARILKARPTKMGKEGVFVQCECLTKGLTTILTPEQYTEMEGLMSKARSGYGIEARNDYLKSLLPRGTRIKDRPFETVKSTCKQYMKVWRNSYSSRDVYTPPPPY